MASCVGRRRMWAPTRADRQDGSLETVWAEGTRVDVDGSREPGPEALAARGTTTTGSSRTGETRSSLLS